MNRFGRSRAPTPESLPKLLLLKYVFANGTLSRAPMEVLKTIVEFSL